VTLSILVTYDGWEFSIRSRQPGDGTSIRLAGISPPVLLWFGRSRRWVGSTDFCLASELGERLFLFGLAGYKPPEPGTLNPEPTIGPWGLWLIPVATTLGGLLSGILVYTFAPEAEGHGTDAAVEAFHFKNGKIRPIVPFIKAIASAITIGSGGAAGREGPTA
jgi:chloride channel protein, CIC family